MREERLTQQKRTRRLKRVRKKLLEVSKRPRLTVFRSNVYLYAQIIDDTQRVTLVSVHEKELQDTKGMTKTQRAGLLGTLITQKAKQKHIDKVVFDRGYYKYHGRVKSFIEAARKEGLVV